MATPVLGGVDGGHALRYMSTATYCMGMFVGGCCLNVLGPVGPSLTSSMHVSLTLIGNVFTAEGTGNTLGSSLIGALLGRYDGHRLFSAVCVTLFFVVGLIPSCSAMWQVVMLYVVIGCCLGLINGASNTLISWVHAGHNVAPWVNLVNASFGLGASSAPLLFVAVEKRVGNALAVFSAIATLAALPALAASLLPSPSAPPPKLSSSGGADEPTAEEARPLRGLGTGHGTSSVLGVDLGSRATYVRVTVIVPLMLMMTLVIGAEIAFAGWIYAYAIERTGMRTVEAAYLNSLFWTTLTTGRICTIPLTAFLTPGTLLIPAMALEVASILLILLHTGSPTALWLGTIGAGIGVCPFYSNVLAMLASYDLLTPSTVAAVGMAAAVGHMSLPNLAGLAIHTADLGGYDSLMYLCGVCDAIGFALLVAVVLHLRQNFEANLDSVQGRRRARELRRVSAAEEDLAAL